MNKIFHNYICRPIAREEKLSSKCNVQTAGYIPLERRIKDMMKCGVRLQSARAEAFDIPPGSNVNDEEVRLDPTRKVGFDLADASAIADDLNARRKAARASKKASDEKGKVSSGKVKPPETDNGSKEVAEVKGGNQEPYLSGISEKK